MPDVTMDAVASAAAEAAHGAIRAFVLMQDENAQQATWGELSPLERGTLVNDVKQVMQGRGPETLHNLWVRGMLSEGWKPGATHSFVHRRSPEIVVWAKLPAESQARRRLWVNVVRAFVVCSEEA